MSAAAPIDGTATAKAPGASATAVDAIRDMILSGDMAPGQRLPPERVLATTLGLSRSSVREAVRQLAALGVLSARQGDGTYVSTLESQDLFAPLDFALRVDSKSLLHLTELRLILEPHAAAVAAARLTDEQLDELKAALAGYESQVESTDPDAEQLLAFDDQIHLALFDTAGNPLIAAIVRSISSVLRRGKEQVVVIPAAQKESLAELRALVDALDDRDPARAHAAMTWHIARWAERIRSELRLGTDEADDADDTTADAS
jgi:GntR family transcriptional repressor for pyruvate dehydrogenase complex